MTSPQVSTHKYAILKETNGKHNETWLYFIRYEGNEENLKKLKEDLDSIDPVILDDLSIFDIDTEHLVSEQTAKEMTLVELNAVMFHRKFDGVLQKIDLGLRKKDTNNKKLIRVFNILGIAGIDKFIDKEDVDEEPNQNSESGSYTDDDSTGTEYFYDDESESSESSESEKKKKKKDDKKKTSKERLAEKIREKQKERSKKEK